MLDAVVEFSEIVGVVRCFLCTGDRVKGLAFTGVLFWCFVFELGCGAFVFVSTLFVEEGGGGEVAAGWRGMVGWV